MMSSVEQFRKPISERYAHGKEYFADFFSLLMIPPNLPFEIMQSYSKKHFNYIARLFHPDTNTDLGATQQQECARRFDLIVQARQVFESPETLARYQTELRHNTLPVSRDGISVQENGEDVLLGEELPHDRAYRIMRMLPLAKIIEESDLSLKAHGASRNYIDETNAHVPLQAKAAERYQSLGLNPDGSSTFMTVL